MLKATLKWALILACLLAVGPLVAELFTRVRDVDGGRAITILVNGNLGAALAAAGALALAVIVVGLVAAKLYTFGTAMACAGFVIAWGASAEGNLESIVRRAGDGQDLMMLAVEGLLVTLAAAAAAALFASAAPPLHTGQLQPATKGPLALLVRGDTRDNPIPIIIAGLAAGVLVAAAGVWLFALSGARNQTLAAAIFAGIAAGAVSHAVTHGRSFTLTPVVPILSMAVLAFIAPVLVKTIEGQKLLAKVYDGSVLNLARPVSLDWAAGALIGVPLGISWAGSSGQKPSK
ncbi:MAG TPA: hypothetical protein VD997_00245 [Phycisphaerales bacterium]|nr:hypothetical protein [Phycisphaerales bacterium]